MTKRKPQPYDQFIAECQARRDAHIKAGTDVLLPRGSLSQFLGSCSPTEHIDKPGDMPSHIKAARKQEKKLVKRVTKTKQTRLTRLISKTLRLYEKKQITRQEFINSMANIARDEECRAYMSQPIGFGSPTADYTKPWFL